MNVTKKEPSSIQVFSAGCALCQQTVDRLNDAAAQTGSSVVERPISGAKHLRAVPAIAIGDDIVFEGLPDRKQAIALVKREQLDRKVLRWAITNSESMQRFAQGDVSMQAVDTLAKEYYPINLEFSLFLAAAISHVRDESTRLLLVGNLYEEHGNLDADRTHTELFRQSMRVLNLNPEEFEKAKPGTASAKVVESYSSTCKQGPDYKALAILYAFETLFSPASHMVATGMRRLDLPPAAYLFFDVHAKADVAHAEQLRTALLEACESEDQWQEALIVAETGGRLLYEFFDEIASIR